MSNLTDGREVEPSLSIRTCRRDKELSPWAASLPWAADRPDTFCATYSGPLLHWCFFFTRRIAVFISPCRTFDELVPLVVLPLR
jgi:hypothetical protein